MTMKSLMAAIALAAAISQPAMAQNPLPFRGTYESSESSGGGTFPVFLQVLGGSGQATHLGRFTVAAKWHVNVLTGTAVGTFRLTAASGDTLVGTANGTSVMLDGLAYITEICVITGGTGRFSGATGTFVTARVLTLAPQPGTAPEESTASFRGTIKLR
jgi:hypothetical protein